MGRKEVKKQSITTITFCSLMSSILHAIISYIAVYFFKPIWKKIMLWWSKK